MPSKNYFFAGLASYVIWGFVPIFLKMLTGYDDHEIIFYRIAVAALIMIVVSAIYGSETKTAMTSLFNRSRKDFWTMIVLTLIGASLLATNWVAYVYVVNHVSVSAASFAYLILPITTALLALLILGESLSQAKWIAVGLSAISCYLMANVDVRQTLYIAAITLSYSFYLISQRKNTFVPRRVSFGLQMIVGSFLMLILEPIKTEPSDLPFQFWGVVFIISAFFTVLPMLLNLYALNAMSSSQLAFLIYINPIIGFISGIVLYGERLNFIAVIAYSLLAVAIVIFNWEFIGRVTARLSPEVKAE